MCLLLALRNAAACQLWVAANRDERLSRGWSAPALICPDPPVFGGVDVEGGGSWLAVNLAAGFVVGVTNARLGARPGRRSRGLLVLDAAMQATLAGAVALLTEVDMDNYGAFNLLLADAKASFVATNYPRARLEPLEEPLVALSNEPLGEAQPRSEAALRALAPAIHGGAGEVAAAMAQLLTDHQGSDPFCRHYGLFGTVCSTILTLHGATVERYLFAAGPPCQTPFQPVALPPPPYS